MSISINSYRPVGFIRGAHLETMVPGLLRKVKYRAPEKEFISTPDDDFLELDWYREDSNSLIILSHGLEGNSTRSYMKGMARIFNNAGYSALCWNYRGCGSKLNRKPRMYHSGATEDLKTVILHAIDRKFKNIGLIGFSLGGNLTLKYVGENGTNLPPQINFSIAFSVPIDLAASSRQISQQENRMYANRFLRKLKKKVRRKHEQYPDIIKTDGLEEIHDLKTFDDMYTAPIHGFSDAVEYYAKCNSKQFLQSVSIPTLIVNALNDPFLPKECYPDAEIQLSDSVIFEVPDHGGHVGFMELNRERYFWSEKRALAFAKLHMPL
jgi:predicted alpha/beta-fold hydrolase